MKIQWKPWQIQWITMNGHELSGIEGHDRKPQKGGGMTGGEGLGWFFFVSYPRTSFWNGVLWEQPRIILSSGVKQGLTKTSARIRTLALGKCRCNVWLSPEVLVMGSLDAFNRVFQGCHFRFFFTMSMSVSFSRGGPGRHYAKITAAKWVANKIPARLPQDHHKALKVINLWLYALAWRLRQHVSDHVEFFFASVSGF